MAMLSLLSIGAIALFMLSPAMAFARTLSMRATGASATASLQFPNNVDIRDSFSAERKFEKSMACTATWCVETVQESLPELGLNEQEHVSIAKDPHMTESFKGHVSETATRSVVKALCWRAIAGMVTFVTTLQFSGSVICAIQVVGTDCGSKSITMFVGERIMNQSQVGRQDGSDTAARSLAKALIWRVFALCNTLAVVVVVSNDAFIASKIASVDAVFKTALMFLYERVWARIAWGAKSS
jgi:uncharacterized membrane protein